MRRSPLTPKRKTPRRSEGRIQHDRMRPKASAAPTAEQQRYHAWLRSLGKCEACETTVDLVIHHILAPMPGKVRRRNHWFVVLICAPDHNGDRESVHGLGSEKAFKDARGVDLCAVSVNRLKEWRDAR